LTSLEPISPTAEQNEGRCVIPPLPGALFCRWADVAELAPPDRSADGNRQSCWNGNCGRSTCRIAYWTAASRI